MCVINNAAAATRPFTEWSSQEQVAFWRSRLQQTPAAVAPPAPAAPVPPTPAPAQAAPAPVDPVSAAPVAPPRAPVLDHPLVQDLRADLARLEEDLSAEKRRSLTKASEDAATIAAMEAVWRDENAAKLAAQAEVVKLKEELEVAKAAVAPSKLSDIMSDDWVTKAQELETFLGSQEGGEFLAAFAVGDDGARDLALALAVKPIAAMVAKVPYEKVELVGRAIDLISGLVTEALKDRLKEVEQSPSPVPDPVAAPAARQHPLKKGGARRQGRRSSLDEEIAELLGEGELRLRRA